MVSPNQGSFSFCTCQVAYMYLHCTTKFTLYLFDINIQSWFSFGNPFHVIARAQSITSQPLNNKQIIFFRCQNSAILFKNILGVLVTGRKSKLPIDMYCVFFFQLTGVVNLRNKFNNKWSFQWNSNFNFNGTVILQLWLLSLVPFRYLVISPFGVLKTCPLKILQQFL